MPAKGTFFTLNFFNKLLISDSYFEGTQTVEACILNQQQVVALGYKELMELITIQNSQFVNNKALG